jgi:hypothetical protein
VVIGGTAFVVSGVEGAVVSVTVWPLPVPDGTGWGTAALTSPIVEVSAPIASKAPAPTVANMNFNRFESTSDHSNRSLPVWITARSLSYVGLLGRYRPPAVRANWRGRGKIPAPEDASSRTVHQRQACASLRMLAAIRCRARDLQLREVRQPELTFARVGEVLGVSAVELDDGSADDFAGSGNRNPEIIANHDDRF